MFAIACSSTLFVSNEHHVLPVTSNHRNLSSKMSLYRYNGAKEIKIYQCHRFAPICAREKFSIKVRRTIMREDKNAARLLGSFFNKAWSSWPTSRSDLHRNASRPFFSFFFFFFLFYRLFIGRFAAKFTSREGWITGMLRNFSNNCRLSKISIAHVQNSLTMFVHETARDCHSPGGSGRASGKIISSSTRENSRKLAN